MPATSECDATWSGAARAARRLAIVVLLVAVASACGREAKVGAPAPAPPATTTPELAIAAPPSSEPAPAGAPEASDGGEDPVPRGSRPTRPSRPAPAGARNPEPTGRIDIPAIGVSHATYEGIELAILNYGPGHWPGTAEPGQRGNTVFPGHRTTYSRPFWDIDRLVVGDHVIFTTPAGRFTYRVDQTVIVDDEDRWIITQTDTATFTIFACHPKGSARQRYVVKGGLVEAIRSGTTTVPPTTTTAPPRETEPLIPGVFP